MYWINKLKGVCARCEQLDSLGLPIQGQECVADDDPRVQDMLKEPEPPPARPSLAEQVADLQARLEFVENCLKLVQAGIAHEMGAK